MATYKSIRYSPLIGPGQVLLKTVTASSSSNLQFTTGITSEYKDEWLSRSKNLMFKVVLSTVKEPSVNGGSTWEPAIEGSLLITKLLDVKVWSQV